MGMSTRFIFWKLSPWAHGRSGVGRQRSLDFAPRQASGQPGNSQGQMGSKPSPDACSLEAESVPIRHSGLWEDSEAHSAGRGEP